MFRRQPRKAAKPYARFTFLNVLTPERLLIIALLVVTIFVWNSLYKQTNRTELLTEQLDKLQDQLLVLEERQKLPQAELLEEKQPAAPAVDSLFSGIIYNGRITISGQSDETYALILNVNGEVRRIQTSHGDTFQFEDIKLKPGLNEISLNAVGADNTFIHVGEMSVTYRSAVIDALSHDIKRGNSSIPSIALTFDGGANDNNAPQILDILREKGVTSTFFLTGKFIQRSPDIVRRIVAEGHEVGNHTNAHSHLTTFEQNFRHETNPDIAYESFQRDLAVTDSLFQAVTGTSMKKFWRAPFGEHNRELREWAAELGYRHISWTFGQETGESMDSHDWVSDEASDLYKSAEEIRDALLTFGENDPNGNGANGAIILMHLGSNRNGDFLYRKLPEIIDGFRQQGYKLCSVSDLLADIDAIIRK